ncbi:hypothetical protein N9H60_02200 [Flavimaricola sp.]|nr:hypothetical protein [Flavimaricola sp.]MDA9019971.1 hypothetical protein [Flavimaricola sp.]
MTHFRRDSPPLLHDSKAVGVSFGINTQSLAAIDQDGATAQRAPFDSGQNKLIAAPLGPI